MHYKEFESLAEVRAHLKNGGDLSFGVFQGLDLRKLTDKLISMTAKNSVFLDCRIEQEAIESLRGNGAVFFPRIRNVPYQQYHGHLYSPEELMGDYEPGKPDSYAKTLDARVYRHYMNHGKDNPDSILESLAQRLHDHSITDALSEFIENHRVVAMMGGHSMSRTAPEYLEVARISRELAKRGFLMASGGGPGAMEATHLGVWFSNRPDTELKEAVRMLSKAPKYNDRLWVETAFRVRRKFPLKGTGRRRPKSLGIPTWLYGHEPPTVFATHIAKYFANSVREEGLLAIAKNGAVYSPGSAGTIQEIFQDATQNHYKSFEIVSPMVLLGEQYWKVTKPVYPLLAQVAAGQEYGRHLHITDSAERVVEILEEFARV